MRRLKYAMTLSLDGYVTAPGDDIGWTEPSDDLHWHHNERTTEDTVALYGRRLWDNMAGYWPSVGDGPDVPAVMADFARRWRAQPKVVFSSTLTEEAVAKVGHNSRLHSGDAVEEIRRLKQGDGGSLEIGGAMLAGAAIRAGLVDEYWLYYAPVAIGAGAPYFRDLDSWLNLRLVETKTFDNGTVLLRYEKG
ncbi:dihydrofolate reductase family protein [Actinophytocola gossypii]|uniref:Dihydrofolate reductase family protein n=1 Tax=Actinophytocola gossypii TaxID=2812003 RepID=A0ABT2J9Z4_9PSEU|nr:dihydrofolate reductase family protein [Actinophytocola gossypii]MCT2584692.1 dihydrofolate reductase family protein [Actinophytocola gossypii]